MENLHDQPVSVASLVSRLQEEDGYEVDTTADNAEAFCVCGHYDDEHDENKCLAVEPERCSCRGFRYGKRSKLR